MVLVLSWHSRCVTSAESSRSVRGLGKGVSSKPYPRLCNARRPRLEPGTFWSQAVRLYRLRQARPSCLNTEDLDQNLSIPGVASSSKHRLRGCLVAGRPSPRHNDGSHSTQTVFGSRRRRTFFYALFRGECGGDFLRHKLWRSFHGGGRRWLVTKQPPKIH